MGVRSMIVIIFLAAILSVTTARRSYAFSLWQLLGGSGEKGVDTFKLLHVADLKELLTHSGDKVHVYDANVVETREQFGTIPGAILLASDASYPLSVLPANKNAILVFYCANLH